MPEEPVIDQFNLVVSDMEATVAFYRLLGLDVPQGDETWDPHHRSVTGANGVDLDLDSTTFYKQWNPGWRAGMGVLGFKVATRDEVDEKYAAVTSAGYGSQVAPHDAFWGARYAIVEDPDGNPIGIMSPVDPARRSPPPNP